MSDKCKICPECEPEADEYDEAAHKEECALIEEIVKKHGGTARFDSSTNSYKISVPAENQVAFSKEMEEKVGK